MNERILDIILFDLQTSGFCGIEKEGQGEIGTRDKATTWETPAYNIPTELYIRRGGRARKR